MSCMRQLSASLFRRFLSLSYSIKSIGDNKRRGIFSLILTLSKKKRKEKKKRRGKMTHAKCGERGLRVNRTPIAKRLRGKRKDPSFTTRRHPEDGKKSTRKGDNLAE